MIEYFCVYTKKGILRYQKGEKPGYLDEIILRVGISPIQKTLSVRGKNITVESRGSDFFLIIDSKQTFDSFEILIEKFYCNFEDFDKNFDEIIKSLYYERSKEDKQSSLNKIKQSKVRRWSEENLDAAILDYSSEKSIPTYSESKLNTITKKFDFPRKFSLFSKKIKIEELKEKLSTHLVDKNVSLEISQKIVKNVYTELKQDGLEYVDQHVFKEKIGKILSNMISQINHEELLENIRKCNQKGKIFSICFVGVNGVGKSTSLAKICCWLLQNNFKVYIAACDTFRAGAIEQLKVHVQRFKSAGYEVGLYEKGYNKSDATVAKNAIIMAKSENYDVILIDTAGRMHNKKELMISLSKLIKTNNPEHLIFVGEALVGSDSLEHLREFNRAVGEGITDKRLDSILLTKMDTVDDKIGQIVNMTVAGNCPILFLGTGQTNMDLTKIDIKTVVDSLMS
ncbi:subunit alpha of signal recognition particle receptor [Hamiltosporidium tvaerminnensis]|uniref:Signal recognition particle receptor subunit alpha homolog n=2 Tax=Hamiltosporidium TaxID=1176354 RepID=A0A4Q9LUM9_9MICR|nr:subunit alpha of signal recognition particle receptor [Hamiltosporidium tvaerminnensis]TBU03932.1 subunit alpha of signal recognition particle receptor [Hamiltosporidium magnivora]TBU12359.1 subunit alpha of signal recognition particle receptor [Hamiltosporidium tvaerminnensis]